jgi:hypothetical protein
LGHNCEVVATDELELVETMEPWLIYLGRSFGWFLFGSIPIIGDYEEVMRRTRLSVRRKSDRRIVYQIRKIEYQTELDEALAKLTGDLASMSAAEFLIKYSQSAQRRRWRS